MIDFFRYDDNHIYETLYAIIISLPDSLQSRRFFGKPHFIEIRWISIFEIIKYLNFRIVGMSEYL